MIRASKRIVAYCKEMGLRNSNKKLVVADHLQYLDSYISAENLYVSLHNGAEKVSYATLYQSLRWLTYHGFVECSKENGGCRNESARYRIRMEALRKCKIITK